MNTIGIIGYGSFGEFLVNKLQDKLSIKVYDPMRVVPKKLSSTLSEVARCNYVIMAIPVDAYNEVLAELKPLLAESTIIVDISSVKTMPVNIIDSILPAQKRVIMHPLFGPQSADKSFWGHVVVMCPTVSSPEAYREVRDYIVSQGLAVVEKNPEEHDKEMAYAQGLTFYLARILLNMGIHDVELLTPSFKKLLDLAELESHHSEDLFRTIQTGNPYLAEIRSLFVETAELLNKQLTE